MRPTSQKLDPSTIDTKTQRLRAWGADKTSLFIKWFLFLALLQSSGCRDCENSADCNPGQICNNNYQCVDQEWEWDSNPIDIPSDSENASSTDTNDTDTDTATTPPPPSAWVFLDGGTFSMGSSRRDDEQPVHQVTVAPFYIMRTEVTIGAYESCVKSGSCAETSTYDGSCTSYMLEETPKRAANCLVWQDAVDYCAFRNARLPTEAEWEFAARSMGQNIKYPWGDEEPTCQHTVNASCSVGAPEEVCSVPKGNTDQGLCDMAGNVNEWVRDEYHPTYNQAPNDGSAWLDGANRVMRGGSYNHRGEDFTVSRRYYFWTQSIDVGFRCARDPE